MTAESRQASELGAEVAGLVCLVLAARDGDKQAERTLIDMVSNMHVDRMVMVLMVALAHLAEATEPS